MAGGPGAVAPGQVLPLRTGAQDPEHAAQELAVVGPGATAAIGPARGNGD